MRVLFVVSGLTYGGAEKQLVELSRALVARGHAVTMYSLSRDVPRSHELEGSGVELRVDHKRLKLDLALLLRLRKYIKAWQPDIVQGFLFDSDFYARLAAQGTGIPVFNSERSDAYVLNFNQKISHWLTRSLVTGVVANTHAGKRFVERIYGYPPERVHVVLNGLNLKDVDQRIAACRENYRQTFFGEAAVRIACLVGAIKPAKDYALALRTAATLIAQDGNWRVLFLGDQMSTTGQYKQGIMDLYEGLGLRERVKFAGIRKDVIEIVQQCDVLFSTSLHEGFPNVVLEAMGAGTPVVSTDYSDIRRILPFPWQVVTERSPAALVAAITRAQAESAPVIEAQRQWVENHASIHQAAARLEGVYLQALQDQPGRKKA